MFFHGINYEHLVYQYPILSPRLTILRQNKQQRQDREHLIERFGFEPVHFLESSNTYPANKCLKECFNFGNVVVAYKKLSLPLLQLSVHEVGVPVIDIRKADMVFFRKKELLPKIKKLLPDSHIFIPLKCQYIDNNIKVIRRWHKSSFFTTKISGFLFK